MKALILAAGNGTRMQPVTRGRHKSLMPLLGLKIIERVILGAKEASINEFVIVTGYKGKDLREFLGSGEKYNVSISFIHNNNWEKANGISALLAKEHFKENFVLLMSDHVFDPSTLKKLQRLKLKKNECALAIDHNLKSSLDIKDTTKVMVKMGKVTNIGKHIVNYNAFDTGMFFCSPHIFKALEKTTSIGKNSLTNGVNVFVQKGNLRTFNNKGNFWADCDTYKDIKFAEKKLLASLTKAADGNISKLLNRKVSTFMTKFLIHTPLTPNIISFIIPFLAIFTFFILAKGGYPWFVFGGLMIQLLSIVDGIDGELSRLKFMGTNWGKWIDPILDRYVDAIVIAGMAYGYWNITGNNFILPIAIFVLLADILQDYMSSKFAVITGVKLKTRDISFKRDARLLLLALGAITNQILIAFIVFIVISQYKVVNRFIAAKRITEERVSSKIQHV